MLQGKIAIERSFGMVIFLTTILQRIVLVYFRHVYLAEPKKHVVRRTSSTRSALVATSTSARESVHSVSAGASLLTRAAVTFVDV